MKRGKFQRIVGVVMAMLMVMGIGAEGFPMIGQAETEPEHYRIFVLDDPVLKLESGKETDAAAQAKPEGQAPYDAEKIKELYASDGHEVTLIGAVDLAKNEMFNAELCDILIIPTGPTFPVNAEENFKAFVRDGGRVITTGGYAFSEMVNPGAVEDAQPDEETPAGQAMKVNSDSTKGGVRAIRRLSQEDLGGTGPYTVSGSVKVSGFNGEGLAHLSLYMYNASGALTKYSDFAYAQSDTDWFIKEYAFDFTDGSLYADILIGFFNAGGSALFDNIKVVDSTGKTVFYETFENGISDLWHCETVDGGSGSFDLGEGQVTRKGDMCLTAVSDSTDANMQWKYDFSPSSFEAGKTYSITVEMMTADVVSTNGIAFASFYVYDQQDTPHEFSLRSVSEGSSGWNVYETQAVIPDTPKMVFFNAGFYLAQGTVSFDNLKVTDEDGGIVYEQNFNSSDITGWQQFQYAGTGTFSQNMRSDIKSTLGSMNPKSVADAIQYYSSSIPLFDIEHHYTDVVRVEASPNQGVFEGEFVSEATPLEGYSSVATIGSNRGRWQPLLTGYDKYGEKQGTIGAIMRLYSPNAEVGADLETWTDYTGTSIAFFGVTTHDLFTQDNEMLRNGFLKLPYILMHDVYTGHIDNKYDNYRQGESPEFTALIENSSAYVVSGKARFEIVSEDTQEVVYTLEETYEVQPKARQRIRAKWETESFADDFYFIRSYVYDAGGTLLDVYETGFSVWNDEVVQNGPKYVYEDNYIKLVLDNGEKKAVFASGVDDSAELLLEWNQTPVVWREEFIARQDAGIHIYENLQQYRWATPFQERLNDLQKREKHYRQVDNIVYLSQKYNQIYMMGVAIGDNCAITDDRLDSTKQIAKEMATRYKDVPGLIYYLNGDLVVRLSSDLDGAFNDFLREKYGSDTALQLAWGDSSVHLGSIPADPGFAASGLPWIDVRGGDLNEFRISLVNNWIQQVSQTIQETDPDGNLILCEFYSWPSEMVDIPSSTGDLSYSNIGYFEAYRDFAKYLATSDQRALGKSMGIGEFGKRTHPLLQNAELGLHQNTTYDEAMNHFFNVFHTTMTMGGNHAQLWSYSETTRYVFPWGMNYANDQVHRDLYYWFRNSNLMMRHFEPVYTPAQVAVITPDNTRLGMSQEFYAGHFKTQEAFNILQSTQIGNILTLNECNLVIPEEVKVIFYPLSYNPSDEVYEKLKAWVNAGGVLYLSGDISYDENRQQTKKQRLEELCGVTHVETIYAGIDHGQIDKITTYKSEDGSRTGKPQNIVRLATAEALYSDANKNPVITVNSLGSGKVIYSTDPIELFNDNTRMSSNITLYKKVMEYAGVTPIQVTQSSMNIKLFQQTLADEGMVTQITNTGTKNTESVTFTLGDREIRDSIPVGNADLVWSDKDNRILGVFNRGDLVVDGQLLVSNGAMSHIFAKDGNELSQSKYIVVTPQYTGKTVIASDAEWTQLSIRFGQVKDGEFLVYGDVPFTQNESGITFEVTEEMRNGIVLISEKEQEENMAKSVSLSLTGKTVVTPGEAEQILNGGLGKSGAVWKIVVLSVVGVLVLCGIGTGVWFMMRKRKKKAIPSADEN